jgi:starch synthase
MTLYAQGTLELLCQVKLIPDLIVTNDWFSGLIPVNIIIKKLNRLIFILNKKSTKTL